jgi:hypothetical protein
MQRHTRLRRALQHKEISYQTHHRKENNNAHDIDVVSCACNRKVLAIMREAQVRDSLSCIRVRESQFAAISTVGSNTRTRIQ